MVITLSCDPHAHADIGQHCQELTWLPPPPPHLPLVILSVCVCIWLCTDVMLSLLFHIIDYQTTLVNQTGCVIVKLLNCLGCHWHCITKSALISGTIQILQH